MKELGLKEALIILILAAILAGLYVQSRQAGREEDLQIRSMLQKIVAVDSIMERDLFRLKTGALQHYDGVTRGIATLGKTFHDLKPQKAAMPTLTEYLSVLEKSISNQKSSLEIFKRSNALFRNSLRYFPVVIKEVVTDSPELEMLLTHVHNDLLQSIVMSEEMSVRHLESYVDLLKQEGQQVLAMHLKVIIDSYGRTEESLNAFVNSGVEESSEALMLAYENYHDGQLKRSRGFGIALVLYSAFLVIFIGVVMYRFQQSGIRLREANVELQYQKFALDEHAIVAVTDHMGNITYANQRFIDISGYSQDELLGQNHRILKSGHHSKEFYQQMWDTIISGNTWHGEVKNRAKNGGYFWVDATIVPFLNAKGKPYKYVAIRTDISARKETEEAQKKLSAAFYYAADALMITDAGGVIEHVNPAFESMTGYSDEEIQGQPATILRSDKHDEDFYIKMTRTLARGEVWKGEVVLLCKDGREKSTLRSIAPVFNENGDIVNNVTYMNDITEEKLLRSKMEHTQRLESLGVMAGGIAHDFNNILTSIMGNAKLAELKIAGGKRAPSPYLERISKASERAADLCRQMLAYSGQGSLQVRPINLTDLVCEIANILEVAVADHVSIHYQLAKDIPSIEADTGQLQQVLMNLITNAGESYEEGEGKVWVDVGKMYVDQAWLDACVLAEGAKEGDYIYIEVRDNGVGMDKATLEKIFEPFFTTKFTGRGLGMSAMMGIVKGHDGAIHIYSEPGQGTIVRVVFPVVTEAAEPLVHEVTYRGIHSKTTIMVVDDEPDILELAEMVLTDLGHDVITATSGEQALEIFRKNSPEIDMVITDATMPQMSGKQLCQQLYAMDKSVKLVLSSGYDVDHATRDIAGEMLSGFIQKPYSPKKLSSEISKILEA